MGFLAPAFLAGLLAIAVPILIHLTHRERREVVVFPSLMFLRKIPFKSVRKQRLRHLLLLAMRCIALLLLVLAFARPLLGRRSDASPTAERGARELVVLLDQSHSMGYGDRWARASEAARSAIDKLAPGDRATIVGFDSRARALTQATADRGVLRAAVDAERPGSGTTRFAPAVRLARGILDESPLPRRHVVLISDFQRNGWNRQDDVHFPPGTVVDHVDLSEERTSNVIVTSVELGHDAAGDRDRTVIAARLANMGTDSVRGREVTLELDGRRVDGQRVTIAPKGTGVVTFSPIAIPDAGARVTVRSAQDALPADDAFHVIVERPRAVQVLVINAIGGSPARTLYLRRALEIGSQPRFSVSQTTIDRVSASNLEGRALVILDDAGAPSADVARRLAVFVQQGGGLIVASGERGATAAWPSFLRDMLPAAVGATIDRTTTRGGTLGTLDRAHPALRLFSARRSGDFTTARIFRYRQAEPRADATILARFDDGAPALLERAEGRGRTVLWTSTFDGLWNDLPVQPVFLPFVHEVAKHAAGHTPDRPWETVGRVADVSRQALAVLGTPVEAASGSATGTELVAVAPSGRRTTLRSNAGTHVAELVEQGFHDIRTLDGRTTRSRAVAVNLDPAESELASVSPEELIASMQGGDSASIAGREAGEATTLTPAERERRQGAWWYLLAAAVVLLVAETALSNHLSRNTVAAPALRSSS